MSYWVHIYCTAPEAPTLRQIIDWAASQDGSLTVDPAEGPAALDTPDWGAAWLRENDGRSPFQSEIYADDGSDDCLFRQEMTELEQAVEEIEPSANQARVFQHLKASRYLVANQLLTSPFEDDEYRGLHLYLAYYVEHCGGLVHADNIGFLDGARVILHLD